VTGEECVLRKGIFEFKVSISDMHVAISYHNFRLLSSIHNKSKTVTYVGKRVGTPSLAAYKLLG
jgi:hypothetical protein